MMAGKYGLKVYIHQKHKMRRHYAMMYLSLMHGVHVIQNV